VKKSSMPEKMLVWIPKENAMTSASGITEQMRKRDQKRMGTSRGANVIPAATATTAWETTEGKKSSVSMFSLCLP